MRGTPNRFPNLPRVRSPPCAAAAEGRHDRFGSVAAEPPHCGTAQDYVCNALVSGRLAAFSGTLAEQVGARPQADVANRV